MKSVCAQAEAALNPKGRIINHVSVQYIGSQMWVAADWSQSRSNLRVAYSRESAINGDFKPTPFSVADAKHNRYNVTKLIRTWVG